MKRIGFRKGVLDTPFSGRAKQKERKEKGESALPFGQKSQKQLEHPYGVSDRIMCLRAPLFCGRFITVISVYAPTLGSNHKYIMAFYQDLRNCIISIPNANRILLLVNFNAPIGSDHENWNDVKLSEIRLITLTLV